MTMFLFGAAWIIGTLVLGWIAAKAFYKLKEELHPKSGDDPEMQELEKALNVEADGLIKLAERVGSLETKVNMLIVYGKKNYVGEKTA